MSLVLNEEQQLLRESVRDFLREKAGVAAHRQYRDSGDETGFSRELWREMASLGWAGIVIPEAFEGLDFGYVGAGLVMEEMGRNLSASPFFGTAVLSASALRHGATEALQQALLPEMAAGERILALAVDEGVRHAPEMTALKAEPNGNKFLLTGTKTFVLDGHVADTLLVLARTSGEAGSRHGLTLFAVNRETPGVQCDRQSMLDHRNAAGVVFAEVVVGADAVLGEPGQAMNLVDTVLDIGRVCLAAEMLGIAQEALERTVNYLKERRQFGVPIGSFQALQHRAAQLFCEIELTKSVVLKALQAIDERDDDLPRLASLAKVKAGATVNIATNEAVQMHGGIGMTDEFDIGFFMKRARAAQQTFGDRYYHAERFASLCGY